MAVKQTNVNVFEEEVQTPVQERIGGYANKMREFALDIIEMSLYLEDNPDDLAVNKIEDDYLVFLEKELDFYRSIVNTNLYKNSKKMREKAQKMVNFKLK